MTGLEALRSPTTGTLPSPKRTAVMLLAIDTLAALLSLLLAIWLRYLWDHSLLWDVYLPLWPAVALFPLVYALVGLYGVGIAPPEELRRLSYATSLVFIVLGSATFMYKAGADYSRGAFVFAWGLALVLVPLGRALAREVFARRPWWGAAVVVLGAGKTGEAVVRALCKGPGLGLKPVALLDDDRAKQGREVEGVPVVGGARAGSGVFPKGGQVRYHSHAGRGAGAFAGAFGAAWSRFSPLDPDPRLVRAFELVGVGAGLWGGCWGSRCGSSCCS